MSSVGGGMGLFANRHGVAYTGKTQFHQDGNPCGTEAVFVYCVECGG